MQIKMKNYPDKKKGRRERSRRKGKNVDSIPSGACANTMSTQEPKKALDPKLDSFLLLKKAKVIASETVKKS